VFKAHEGWKEIDNVDGLASCVHAVPKNDHGQPAEILQTNDESSYANGPHPGNTYGANACCRAIRAHSSTTAGTAPSVKASSPHCSSLTWTSGGESNATSA